MENEAESDEIEEGRLGEGGVEKSRKKFTKGEAFLGKGILKFFPHLTTTKKVTRIAGTFVRF